MAKKLSGARFFFTTNDIRLFATLYKGRIEEVLESCFNGDFECDFINLPFHFTVRSNGTLLEAKVFLDVLPWSTFDEHDPPMVIKVYRKEHSYEFVRRSEENREDFTDDVGNLVMVTALDLCKCFEENPQSEQYFGMDTRSEGVLIASKENKLIFQRVSGKNRPDLCCIDMFGTIKTARPYPDEGNDYTPTVWDAMSGIGRQLGFGGGGISFGGEPSLEQKIKLAEGGDTGVMNELAALYMNGDSETKADPEKAVYWFKKLAEHDDATAQYNLGLSYAKGHGVARDFAKAAYWMQHAADNGVDLALPFIEKFSKAAEAQKKVDSGDPQAQTNLGDALLYIARSRSQTGNEEEDMKLAFDLLTKAAKKGYGPAMQSLADCYELGNGCEQNWEESIKWYKKAYEELHDESLLEHIDMIEGFNAFWAENGERLTKEFEDPSDVEPLLKQAFTFLEDGKWKNADEYCDKVLDEDPENAKAYLGKLMAELEVRKQEDLKKCLQDFSNKNNYQKAINFADEELKKELESAIAFIKERKETERKADIYNSACKTMGNAAAAENYEKEYENAAKRFKSISGFKDADAKAKECKKLAEEKRKIEDKMSDAIIVALQDPESIGNQLQHLEDEKNKLNRLFKSFASRKKEYDRLSSQMQASEKGISELKAERAKLGLFAGKRKKDISTKIEEMQSELASIQAALAQRETDLMGYSSKQAVKVGLDELDKDIKKKKALCGSAIIYSAEDAIKQMLQSRRLQNAVYAKNPEVVWRAIQKGFIVKYGVYRQSDSTAKTPIEWIVLAKENDKAFLISRYALDVQPYNVEKASVTWETCTLRKWLNSEFINAAFTAEEQKKIQETTVTADKNPKYDTDPGRDTTDKIFLLSINEVNQYLTSKGDRICAPTAYAKSQGAWSSWRLRSPGSRRNSTTFVNSKGDVDPSAFCPNSHRECVRPALWISLDP